MKRYPIHEKIDTEKEIDAIASFVSKHWKVENDSNFLQFVTYAFECGVCLMKHAFFSSYIEQYLREKIDFDNDPLNFIKLEREMRGLGEYLMTHFEYEQYIGNVLKDMKSQFPAYKNIKPRNWAKYQLDPDKYDQGHDYYDSKNPDSNEEDNFHGMQKDYQAGYNVRSFPSNISRGSVLYAKERDRNPFETLVNSIVTQATIVQMHNNTSNVLQELDSLRKNAQLDSSLNKNNIIEHIYNPILKTAYLLVNSKLRNDDIDDNISKAKAKAVKNPQPINPAAIQARISAIMAGLKSGKFPEPTEEEKAQEKEEEKRKKDIMYSLVEHLYNDSGLVVLKKKNY